MSQALRVGGYHDVGGYPNSQTDNSLWFYSPDYLYYSHSWSVALDQISFQIMHSPGGYYGNYYNGNIGDGTNNDAYIRDMLNYDFGTGNGYSHLSMEIGYGNDYNSGWTGDLVDQHTTNRLHAYWTLQPYNTQYYNQTKIRTIHISPNN